MADIAFVFHWSPESLDALPLDELQQWHKRALDRFRATLPRRTTA